MHRERSALLILTTILAAAFCGGFFASGAAEPSVSTNSDIASLADLQGRLSNHVCAPRFIPATFAVKIISAATGKTVFEHDASELLSPASNAKLYTVALALDRLGPDFRIGTSIYAEAAPTNGVVEGDLVVFGRGDPLIHARAHGGNLSKSLEPLVRGITNAGVRVVTGDLVCDESYFIGDEFGSGWTWNDLESYYGAEISALTIADNVIRVRVKGGEAPGEPCVVSMAPETALLEIENTAGTGATNSASTLALRRSTDGRRVYISGRVPVGATRAAEIPVRKPAALFGQVLRIALEQHGIQVAGTRRVVSWRDPDARRNKLGSLVELARMESAPVKDIAREVQKASQNLYADLLLAQVGEASRRSMDKDRTSEELGIRELKRFLKKAGINEGEVQLEEGSGLSRNNLTTANATVALLQYMSSHPAAEVYWNALPVAGVDGTLRDRLTAAPARGNVRAKTGSLRWANSLSGDVKTAGGERLLFSIMLNRYFNSNGENQRPTRSELDAIVEMLAGFGAKVAIQEAEIF